MSEPIGPAIARVRLSTHLRLLRGEKPAAAVAKAMHWSLSKLNRIENNKVTIQPVEVEALAHHYGVADQAEVRKLVDLSLVSRRRMWWRDEHEYLDEDFINFIAFENDASHIYGYHASLLPWLLQTPEYALAMTSSILRKPIDDPDVRKIVDVRLKRQETLRDRLDGDFPPRISLALDEAVLLRPVGGDEVMAAQIDHLVELTARPEVEVVVLPFRLGVHPGLGGTFEMLTFSEDEDLDVVFIETPATGFLLTDAADTTPFREIMSELLATDPDGESLDKALAGAIKALRP
ncbi:helix-turn-helix domain-containing protein [Actinoplanes sp. CA-142083]|uniref:helix-turn-helix domain-containing protein n=1 Tax=Actinoplanes sp. CA-142083 TaxID=3239903 RepID=UPI003D89DB81